MPCQRSRIAPPCRLAVAQAGSEAPVTARRRCTIFRERPAGGPEPAANHVAMATEHRWLQKRRMQLRSEQEWHANHRVRLSPEQFGPFNHACTLWLTRRLAPLQTTERMRNGALEALDLEFKLGEPLGLPARTANQPGNAGYRSHHVSNGRNGVIHSLLDGMIDALLSSRQVGRQLLYASWPAQAGHPRLFLLPAA